MDYSRTVLTRRACDRGMSLDVSVYRLHPDGSATEVPLDERDGNPHLAGFESWRRQVWGSAIVCSWGCHVLPSLATGDVYASGDGLEELAREVALLERRLDELAVAVGVEWDVLAYRLGNIRRAVALALDELRGTVEVRVW